MKYRGSHHETSISAASKLWRRTISSTPMPNEIAFEMAISNIRFGAGVTREAGMDLADLGTRRVLVLTDPVVRNLPPVHTLLESLDRSHIDWTLYDRVRVEPTDQSFEDAIGFARRSEYDAYVAI